MPERCVIVAAPHTSNWDFPLTLALAAMIGAKINWLGKAELFKGPMGPVMRRLGGVPVDRSAAAAMVPQMVARFATEPRLHLVVPVEGTRSHGEYWKSGFLRIATQADVPLVLAFVDRATRSGGFGPAMRLSGDVRADMDQIRAFYAGKEGLKPGRTAVPRLKEEDLTDV